jgi:hypothetical protein
MTTHAPRSKKGSRLPAVMHPEDWPHRYNPTRDREPCCFCGEATRTQRGWEIRQAGVWVAVCRVCDWNLRLRHPDMASGRRYKELASKPCRDRRHDGTGCVPA